MAILSWFNAAGLITKLITLGGILLGLVGIYGTWHHHIYQSGVNDTVAKFALADKKLVDRALKARAVLKDCKARGLKWDQTSGACAQ